ncbi:MAG TPA: VOC family protein [Streptosporangiaceae bacterium]
MVTRDTPWPPGTPCWVDLSVDDVARAGRFYGGLFGWDLAVGPPEAGGYTMCEAGGEPVAGIGPKMGEQAMPSVWTTYLASADADQTAARIKAAGGQVMAEPFDVMDVGRMAIAADPGGAVFGVWQARTHTGNRRANEPGSPTWNENMSRDFDANKNFYHAVFGYDFGDMSSEGFSYATLDLDGATVGGIGGLPADVPASVPAYWGTYFGVTDTDATVAKAVELGGKVVRPASDTPYGRMATLTDEEGATFSVMTVRSGS